MNLLSARTLERVDVRCVLEGKPDVVQPVDEVLLAERVDVEPVQRVRSCRVLSCV